MIEIGRRSFLRGLAGALITAPAIVRSTSLMPVRTPGTATVVGDIVMQNGAIYVCTLAGVIGATAAFERLAPFAPLSPLISEQVATRAAAWIPK
jgi:hypothetical protein